VPLVFREVKFCINPIVKAFIGAILSLNTK